MSDKQPPVPHFEPFTDEQLEKIAGGECTAAEWSQIFEDLKENYETLIDFTSYVIERVATSTSGG